jgi:hypothetical protein
MVSRPVLVWTVKLAGGAAGSGPGWSHVLAVREVQLDRLGRQVVDAGGD